MTIQYKPIAKRYGLFYFHSCNYRNSPIQFHPYLQQKKEYGRLIYLAGYTERSSEDNKDYNRPDPHAQEEKRMNFVCKYAYILKIIPIFAVLITY